VALADVSPARAHDVVAKLGEAGRFSAERVDASDRQELVRLIERVRPDAVLNACDPRFNEPIFGAAFDARTTYLDMAMTLSHPHPERPHELPGVMLGDLQLARSEDWERAGLLALVGIGVEPGLSDVFARYAAERLFSKVDQVGVRDGADLVVEGYDFAPTFSIWTTIEECLNPPLIWERARGFYTTAPFSEPETFDFPEGIGRVECVNVEHEEVVLIPRWVQCERVTFKYGLGQEFIDVLRTLHKLGLDSTEPVGVRAVGASQDGAQVARVRVSPRDVVAATLPDPATLGERMTGRTCAGTWVTGTGTDDEPRSTYLYHIVDNEHTMREYGSQAVVWQTAINPVVALELLDEGVWKGTGVLGPEAFAPEPFLERLAELGSPHGQVEVPLT
jgi:saccharopine dehydrogenase (NAD+, L-lysine forming)